MIKANSSTETVASVNRQYGGVDQFTVLAVNPNEEQLKAVGIETKTAPKYSDIAGKDRTYSKVAFLVRSVSTPDFITRVEFLLADEVSVATSGNTEFVNTKGQHTYAPSMEALGEERYKWFTKEGVRPAFRGESDLIEFIRAWANVASGSDMYLETIKNIASKGDVRELVALHKEIPNNALSLLVGASYNHEKSRFYQRVYTRFFGRAYTSKTDFQKHLNKQGGAFNAVYPTDLSWQEMTPEMLAVEAPASGAPSSAITTGDDTPSWMRQS